MELRKSERKLAKIKMALQGSAGSGKTYSNSLCILNNANFNIVNISIEYKFIDVLNSCQSSYLG